MSFTGTFGCVFSWTSLLGYEVCEVISCLSVESAELSDLEDQQRFRGCMYRDRSILKRVQNICGSGNFQAGFNLQSDCVSQLKIA